MGDTALRVDVEFDRILNPALDPLLSVDGLASDALSSVHWNTPASGIQIRDEAATELEGLWASHLQRFGLSADDRNAAELRSAATEVNESGYFSPDTLHDERERRLRQIVQRRGQPDFRNKLIAAYQARCAVTGCDAVAALEAAHIIPYCGPDSNHVTNGVLLRADIHSLFDLDLMAINPEGWTVDLVPSLRATSYSELLGRRIGVPTNLADHPSQAAIVQRWQRFVSQ